MDCGTSDGPKWSFSRASHDDMDFMTPPPQFSGAYTQRYEETAGLPVPPPDLFGKPNWCSLASTSTSTSSLVGNPRPQEQEQASSMREMIFSIAAMQPIHIDPESVKPPKRKNVKISKDPQSVAARHRRERISERIRILQRLVPGGTKMDTASMLDEAIHYLKFLQSQVHSLQLAASHNTPTSLTDLFISSGANNNPSSNYLSLQPPHHPHHYC